MPISWSRKSKSGRQSTLRIGAGTERPLLLPSLEARSWAHVFDYQTGRNFDTILSLIVSEIYYSFQRLMLAAHILTSHIGKSALDLPEQTEYAFRNILSASGHHPHQLRICCGVGVPSNPRGGLRRRRLSKERNDWRLRSQLRRPSTACHSGTAVQSRWSICLLVIARI